MGCREKFFDHIRLAREMGSLLEIERPMLGYLGLFKVCLSGMPCIPASGETVLGTSRHPLQEASLHKMGV